MLRKSSDLNFLYGWNCYLNSTYHLERKVRVNLVGIFCFRRLYRTHLTSWEEWHRVQESLYSNDYELYKQPQ
jgi:hypothetical protein